MVDININVKFMAFLPIILHISQVHFKQGLIDVENLCSTLSMYLCCMA